MGNALVTSKEVIVVLISFILGAVVDITGITFPLTPDQIYAAGLALVGIIRVIWTEGKISNFLPKKQ